jgi:hypothetical protein
MAALLTDRGVPATGAAIAVSAMGGASLAGRVGTGWLLDRTHSFHLTLVICAGVSLLGALSYLLIVKDPIPSGDVLAIS